MRLIDADALFAGVKTRHDLFIDSEYIGDKARRDELGIFMADIVNAPTIGGWISVKDKKKLPKGECIAYSSKFDEMIIGYIGEAQDSDTGYCAENQGEFLCDVTHWMPFYELPMEGDNE